METKSFKFEVKSVQDDGSFSGYAAVFGNVDNGNDRIQKGAFTKTLMERKQFPLYYAHNGMKIPVGDVCAEQDDFGLKVDGMLYLNDFEGKPLQEPRQLHMSMKRKVVNGMSIGYNAVKKAFEGSIRNLSEIKLFEISVLPWGMNELAQVTDVKSLEGALAGVLALCEEQKSGKMFSSANLKLIQQAAEALNALLKAAEPSEGDTPKGWEPPDKADKSGQAHSLADLYEGITNLTKSIRA